MTHFINKWKYDIEKANPNTYIFKLFSKNILIATFFLVFKVIYSAH